MKILVNLSTGFQVITYEIVDKLPLHLIERFKQANQRLVELYDLCGPDEIVIRIKEDSRPFTLRQLVVAVEAHIRNHLLKLRKDAQR